MEFDYSLLLRLVAAVLLGGIIGLERTGTKHEAGLRTHMILCLGAALIMVISECMAKDYGIKSEVMRMGAQIISGVGFLGAGSIIVTGNKVRGITTAAGLWTTACVGIAVGAGYYIIAIAAVALMLFAMVLMHSVSQSVAKDKHVYRICVSINESDEIANILNTLANHRIKTKGVRFQHEQETDTTELVLDILPPKKITPHELALQITNFGKVTEFKEVK